MAAASKPNNWPQAVMSAVMKHHDLFFSIGNERRKPGIEHRLQEERTFG